MIDLSGFSAAYIRSQFVVMPRIELVLILVVMVLLGLYLGVLFCRVLFDKKLKFIRANQKRFDEWVSCGKNGGWF